MGDVFLMQFYCQCGPQVSQSGLHYVCSDVVGAFPCTDVDAANTFDSNIAPLMLPLMAADSSYFGVTVQKIFPMPPAVRILSASHSAPGSTGTITLPSQTSGLVKWKTDFAGRAGHGRMYIPFPTQSANSPASGGLTPKPLNLAYIAPLNNLVAFLKGPVVVVNMSGATATLKPILLDRLTFVQKPITSSLTETAWATTRRRGAFGRQNALPT